MKLILRRVFKRVPNTLIRRGRKIVNAPYRYDTLKPGDQFRLYRKKNALVWIKGSPRVAYRVIRRISTRFPNESILNYGHLFPLDDALCYYMGHVEVDFDGIEIEDEAWGDNEPMEVPVTPITDFTTFIDLAQRVQSGGELTDAEIALLTPSQAMIVFNLIRNRRSGGRQT